MSGSPQGVKRSKMLRELEDHLTAPATAPVSVPVPVEVAQVKPREPVVVEASSTPAAPLTLSVQINAWLQAIDAGLDELEVLLGRAPGLAFLAGIGGHASVMNPAPGFISLAGQDDLLDLDEAIGQLSSLLAERPASVASVASVFCDASSGGFGIDDAEDEANFLAAIGPLPGRS